MDIRKALPAWLRHNIRTINNCLKTHITIHSELLQSHSAIKYHKWKGKAARGNACRSKTYHRRSPKRTCYLSPRFVELVRGYRQMASKKHGTISRSLEKRQCPTSYYNKQGLNASKWAIRAFLTTTGIQIKLAFVCNESRGVYEWGTDRGSS